MDMCTHQLQEQDPRQNQLLAALPADVLRRLQPHLEPVALQLGQVLCGAGSTPVFAHFPTTAIVSLMYLTREGASAELAVVGHDGVVGIALFTGGNATPSESVVHGAGWAYRLSAVAMKREVGLSGSVLAQMLGYTEALMVQVAQTALSHRYQSIDQLLCRRLLMALDRSDSDELALTHELLANLLGVRREGITAAALRLQQEGAISYSRGRITVLDRSQLRRGTQAPQPRAKPVAVRLASRASRQLGPMALCA